MRSESRIHATVVTINSIRDYPVGASTIEAFATGLFNEWGVGSKEDNDGVLLLVAIKDRKVRIEVGSGFGHTRDIAMKEIIDTKILPEFRARRISAGIKAGVDAVCETLRREGLPPEKPTEAFPAVKNVSAMYSIADRERAEAARTSASVAPGMAENAAPPSPGVAAPAPGENMNAMHKAAPAVSGAAGTPVAGRTPTARVSRGSGKLPWFVGGGVLLAIIGGVGALFRSRKKTCPQCGIPMTLLDEQSDDAHLDRTQQMEEQLKSVDYRVWVCSQCQAHLIDRNVKWFSGYSDCPACGAHTLSSTSEVVRRPTHYRTGSKRTTTDCANCGHHNVEVSIMPVVPRSSSRSSSSSFSSSSSSSRSSSSGSSFGGGRSSGGGASGSW
jgi:uncharacterized protein